MLARTGRKADVRMQKRRGISRWERYLTKEIEIEFKACLFFFCILFFYSCYQILRGVFEIKILFMAEMIFTTYIMGYVQVFLLESFDEAERYGKKEIFYSLLCSAIYTFVAYVGGWFERQWLLHLVFFLFMELTYFCGFLLYRAKRNIDTKLLNEELRVFQKKANSENGLETEEMMDAEKNN